MWSLATGSLLLHASAMCPCDGYLDCKLVCNLDLSHAALSEGSVLGAVGGPPATALFEQCHAVQTSEPRLPRLLQKLHLLTQQPLACTSSNVIGALKVEHSQKEPSEDETSGFPLVDGTLLCTHLVNSHIWQFPDHWRTSYMINAITNEPFVATVCTNRQLCTMDDWCAINPGAVWCSGCCCSITSKSTVRFL
ncbi:hypothetical protein HPB50_015900 [Hyalomma asiaticum]|uniref:Uncharacterized protein n=1 Tax=Hyalomma asiaticum TaxID=266040 RepID=A0ACB7SEB7_HYAAI|nr:hypothetical protein HPB50_015900 [Hyalomma asiaticum]